MNQIALMCTANDDIFYAGPIWGATDALVNYYCDNRSPRRDIYVACCALGDAISRGEWLREVADYLACCEV